MNEFPRVALFADTFHEINGAANILRRLAAYAKEHNRPFLCVRAGNETRSWREGSVEILELKRSRAALTLNEDLQYDPLFWRYHNLIKQKLKDFKPDVLHLTGVNDISLLGFVFAHFKHLPAVASWHTNAHEYLAQRTVNRIPFLPAAVRTKFKRLIEKNSLRGVMKMYFLAQIQLAPNVELVEQIRQMTKRPTFLLERGVDAEFFAPEKRRRSDKTFNLGFVGRLRSEKNVRFLAKVDAALQKAGVSDYRFIIVGEGNESDWLRHNIKNIRLTGVLHGEELARAYADMDLVVFPSKTDAFGNVALEAMASGVPSVVMPEGGPKFLIEHGTNGFIARNDTDFCEIVSLMVREPERLNAMRENARETALKYSWENIFESVFEKYKLARTVKKNVRASHLD
ncbi:MAG: glycosyltransferase [Acidobacteriota bacterium]|nr:glycosyltransferase [Acidobacteriota bacterium]